MEIGQKIGFEMTIKDVSLRLIEFTRIVQYRVVTKLCPYPTVYLKKDIILVLLQAVILIYIGLEDVKVEVESWGDIML